MWLITAASDPIAGDVLDWVKTKEGEIKGLIPDLLWLATAFCSLVAWVGYRSWKKAMVAGIGGAIVIALVNQLNNLSDKVESELDTAPPAVVRHEEQAWI